MAYYQILKKRRLDLNLSIQDIAIQTHLTPEYIRAIEDNNLDVFSDDFSFVRYFTHSYCDAIGVNWEAVSQEVDAAIAAYSAARDQTLTQAQRKMAESIPSATRPKKSKKKKSRAFQNSAGKVSRTLNWSNKDRLTKTLIAAGVAVIGGLMILNAAVNAMAQKSVEAAREAKNAELQEKELETQRLADQLAAQKQQTALNAITASVSAKPDSVNTFYVTGVISQEAQIPLSFTLVEASQITIDVDGSQVAAAVAQDTFSQSLSLTKEGTVTITFGNFTSGDYMTIAGVSIPVNADEFEDGAGEVTLEIVKEIPETQEDAQDTDENAEDVPEEETVYDEQEGWDYNYDEYYQEEYDPAQEWDESSQ